MLLLEKTFRGPVLELLLLGVGWPNRLRGLPRGLELQSVAHRIGSLPRLLEAALSVDVLAFLPAAGPGLRVRTLTNKTYFFVLAWGDLLQSDVPLGLKDRNLLFRELVERHRLLDVVEVVLEVGQDGVHGELGLYLSSFLVGV